MADKIKKGYPAYDDDKFYDMGPVVSSTDCTGLIPTPPASEAEAESYAEIFNIPQSTEKVDNGLQNIKKTKNNEDLNRK